MNKDVLLVDRLSLVARNEAVALRWVVALQMPDVLGDPVICCVVVPR